ncbi:MAG TPA: GNAT family N-acetyltransferase [Candidatus Companilactobacillus pullicola]|uniref:GNAT family N-acetyltransferase n=1 Tax=Candidatus Companilactobacillus pullicola TaxID=2838523 RepID=A0A9D1ZKH8_9LACO|nr:GNAT family N-acetyltransferase [Candidatus Companilactobacillus pullicola]
MNNLSKVELRQAQPEDLEEFWELAFSDPNAGWTKLNGPYFHDDLPSKEKFINELAPKVWLGNKDHLLITSDGKIVGSVGGGFEDGKLAKWYDMGITIYATDTWDKHIGSQALKLFITYLFKLYDLPHLGLTTWSGNPRMMHVAEKIGMKQEARIRKVRFYEGKYYDSVKYGILRDEWE